MTTVRIVSQSATESKPCPGRREPVLHQSAIASVARFVTLSEYMGTRFFLIQSHEPRLPMALARTISVLAGLLLGLCVTGCASTKVTSRQMLVTGQIPRPDHILIYNFAATPADVPSSSEYADPAYRPPLPQTSEEIQLGRELGSQVAYQLVREVQEMGMPAVQAAPGTQVRLNDIVIRGYFVSVDEGSTAKRLAIGFGSGSSKLVTVVEGYQMTATGLRKLGSGTVDAGGSKGPGASLGVVGWVVTGSPLGLIASGGAKAYGELSGSSKVQARAKATAKEIAEHLQKRFEQQGWIHPN